MHLLVLSAFRLGKAVGSGNNRVEGLNAPFGAQCFPTRSYIHRSGSSRSQCTFWCSVLSDTSTDTYRGTGCLCLNAPFGAQCFPTAKRTRQIHPSRSQCTFWCSVLSDLRIHNVNSECTQSQCTFWCSVLSDLGTKMWMISASSSLNAPFGAQCFPTVLTVGGRRTKESWSQCTFWCSVLSDSETR